MLPRCLGFVGFCSMLLCLSLAPSPLLLTIDRRSFWRGHHHQPPTWAFPTSPAFRTLGSPWARGFEHMFRQVCRIGWLVCDGSWLVGCCFMRGECGGGGRLLTPKLWIFCTLYFHQNFSKIILTNTSTKRSLHPMFHRGMKNRVI